MKNIAFISFVSSLKVTVAHQHRIAGLRWNHSGIGIYRPNYSLITIYWMFSLSRFVIIILTATVFTCGVDFPLSLLQINGLWWKTSQTIWIHFDRRWKCGKIVSEQKFEFCERKKTHPKVNANETKLLQFTWLLVLLVLLVLCIKLGTVFAERVMLYDNIVASYIHAVCSEQCMQTMRT